MLRDLRDKIKIDKAAMQNARVVFLLANTAYLIKDFADAENLLQEAVRLDPENLKYKTALENVQKKTRR
ncbi:MAG: hypothetical protein KDK41_11140 [Leptospiraceae bacterium]|nr:hypothetical protein [Leptospiraceae bacterium]MCB1201191.1 hypothetical protein [Leptospiraceae bacterium]